MLWVTLLFMLLIAAIGIFRLRQSAAQRRRRENRRERHRVQAEQWFAEAERNSGGL